jgi:hypothetical protein
MFFTLYFIVLFIYVYLLRQALFYLLINLSIYLFIYSLRQRQAVSTLYLTEAFVYMRISIPLSVELL